MSMGVRLFPAVHGHIADSVRDHERGWMLVVTAELPPGSWRSQGFVEPFPGLHNAPWRGWLELRDAVGFGVQLQESRTARALLHCVIPCAFRA